MIRCLTAFLLMALALGPARADQNFTSFQFPVTGGTVNRTDPARWVDNWFELNEKSGVDCTGVSDSTTALQALITAASNGATFVIPQGCNLLVGTGGTGLSLVDKIGLSIISFSTMQNGGGGQPTFTWNGSSGILFSVQCNDHPFFQNFKILVPFGKSMDRAFDFGSEGGCSQTPTAATVDHVTIDAGAQANDNFIGLAIDTTLTRSNHENYQFTNLDIYCSTIANRSSLATRVGITTSGSANVSAASGTPFNSGMVGKKILLTNKTGVIADTTVLTFTDSTHIVLAANASASDTNVTIHVGRSSGTGIYVGGNGNALHEKIYNVRALFCAIGLNNRNGQVDVRHWAGGSSDVGIDNHGTLSLQFYESENDVRFIRSYNSINYVTLKNFRSDNTNQRADGFLNLGVNSSSLYFIENGWLPNLSPGNGNWPTNVLFIKLNDASTQVVSIANQFGNLDWTDLNYDIPTGPPVVSIGDVLTNPRSFFFNQPTSCSGQATGTIANVATVLTVCP